MLAPQADGSLPAKRRLITVGGGWVMRLMTPAYTGQVAHRGMQGTLPRAKLEVSKEKLHLLPAISAVNLEFIVLTTSVILCQLYRI